MVPRGTDHDLSMTIEELCESLRTLDPQGRITGVANDHSVKDGMLVLESGYTRILPLQSRLSRITRSFPGTVAVSRLAPVLVRDGSTLAFIERVSRDGVVILGEPL